MSEIELAKDLTYEEKPIRILDQTERVTRSKEIRFYKVLACNKSSTCIK